MRTTKQGRPDKRQLHREKTLLKMAQRLAGKRYSVPEMMSEFEISQRSVYLFLDLLEERGHAVARFGAKNAGSYQIV